MNARTSPGIRFTVCAALLLAGMLFTKPACGQRSMDEITNRPFTITSTREETYTVQVPRVETTTVYQRYGLFGRKCRAIRIQVTRYYSETKTKTLATTSSIPPLTSNPDSAFARETLVLPGVDSLAARTVLLESVLRSQFGDWVLQSEVEDDFTRIRSQEPRDQVSIEVTALLVIGEPRQVEVDVTTAIEGNKLESKSKADSFLAELSQRLTSGD